ncbi:Phosphoribosyl transferase [Candidatus Electronema halotolerans]
MLLIGLTESGIVPSFLMHIEACRQGIPCKWVCSTRRTGIAGLPFQELHSHGPDHTLPLPPEETAEVWIVEDEITSGTTVKNLISQIQEHLAAPVFRIFSFADSRSAEQKEDFFHQFSGCGKRCLFHALASAAELCSSAPPDSICKAAACPADLLRSMAAQLGKAHLLRKQGGEHLLVVGESVSTAVLLVVAGIFECFHHVTLSPWSVDHVNITSRMDFAEYYLYNWQQMHRPVHLLHDQADRDAGERVRQQLELKGTTVNIFS